MFNRIRQVNAKIECLALFVLAVVVTSYVEAETLHEFVDDRGVSVVVPATPKRIATISTFAADTVMALGHTPVAASAFGNEAVPFYLGETMKSVPSLGMRAKSDLEKISQLKPDVILAIRRYTEPYARKFNEIAPYLAFNAITYEDSLFAVETIGRLMGEADKGQHLNEKFEAQLQTYRRRAPGGIRAAILVSSGETPFAYYSHFFPVALMTKLKAENVIGEHSAGDDGALGYRISLEKLLQLNPDVLFICKSVKQRAYEQNPIWKYLKAVRLGKVYEVGQHWKEGVGPLSRRYILEELAHRLYPSEFPQPDLPETLRSRILPSS